jgi:hypothetical protein
MPPSVLRRKKPIAGTLPGVLRQTPFLDSI